MRACRSQTDALRSASRLCLQQKRPGARSPKKLQIRGCGNQGVGQRATVYRSIEKLPGSPSP
jgi:hypothetical protein